MVLTWTCSNIHQKERKIRQNLVFPNGCAYFQDKSPQQAITLSCSRESSLKITGKNSLLLDDNADLALVKHVIEGPSLPLLVPVVHLPHTSSDQTQGQSNEDLLHHAGALEGSMCNPAACHLPGVEVRRQVPKVKKQWRFCTQIRGCNRQTAYLHYGTMVLLINADMCTQHQSLAHSIYMIISHPYKRRLR